MRSCRFDGYAVRFWISFPLTSCQNQQWCPYVPAPIVPHHDNTHIAPVLLREALALSRVLGAGDREETRRAAIAAFGGGVTAL